MPNSGFFGWVWKFNAIAIAFAATGAIVVIALIFGSFALNWSRRWDWRGETDLVQRGADARPEFKYALQRTEELEGTQSVLYPLERYSVGLEPVPVKSAYRYESKIVNLLLIDGKQAKGRWLFDGVRQVIAARTAVYDPASLTGGLENRLATAILTEVHATDTNNDGEIDERDDVALIAHRLSDGSKQVLMSGPMAIASSRQVDGGKILIMYESGKATTLAIFDAVDFRPLGKSDLPRLSTDPPRSPGLAIPGL